MNIVKIYLQPDDYWHEGLQLIGEFEFYATKIQHF